MTDRNVRDLRTLTHAEAMDLAVVEHDRLLALLRVLDDGEWGKPTDCQEWNVADVVRHLLGSAHAFGSVRELIHQQRASRKAAGAGARPGEQLEAMNAVQVRERADLPPQQLIARYADVGARALRARRRKPAFMRALPMQLEHVGRSSFGYLIGPVLLRDVWLHRCDIARAAGRPFEATAEHDGRIVEDVLADWAPRHGRAFRLELTGAAGGTYVQQGSGPIDEQRLDAVEFCRVLSGRGAGEGVLANPHLF